MINYVCKLFLNRPSKKNIQKLFHENFEISFKFPLRISYHVTQTKCGYEIRKWTHTPRGYEKPQYWDHGKWTEVTKENQIEFATTLHPAYWVMCPVKVYRILQKEIPGW